LCPGVKPATVDPRVFGAVDKYLFRTCSRQARTSKIRA